MSLGLIFLSRGAVDFYLDFGARDEKP